MRHRNVFAHWPCWIGFIRLGKYWFQLKKFEIMEFYVSISNWPTIRVQYICQEVQYLHKKDHSMVIDGQNMIIFFECKKQILTLVREEKRYKGMHSIFHLWPHLMAPVPWCDSILMMIITQFIKIYLNNWILNPMSTHSWSRYLNSKHNYFMADLAVRHR